MRSTPSFLLLLLAGLSCVSCKSTRDPRESWTAGEGYKYLIVARRFALGGVGVAGQTSTGEFAFQAVLKDRNAAHLFKAVFLQGTEEGKLYALCGVRVKDRSAFDGYASPVVSTNAEVTTQSGCTVRHEKATDVVKRIREGFYDWHIANP